MRAIPRLIVLFAAFIVGCGPAPPSPSAPPIATADRAIPAASRSATGDVACQSARDAERLTINAGQAVTTRSSVTIRFSGTSHDSYDDGRTDLLLNLEISGAGGPTFPWMPSAFAPPTYRVFGGFCIRIAESSGGQILVDVAPLPTAPHPEGPTESSP